MDLRAENCERIRYTRVHSTENAGYSPDDRAGEPARPGAQKLRGKRAEKPVSVEPLDHIVVAEDPNHDAGESRGTAAEVRETPASGNAVLAQDQRTTEGAAVRSVKTRAPWRSPA